MAQYGHNIIDTEYVVRDILGNKKKKLSKKDQEDWDDVERTRSSLYKI